MMDLPVSFHKHKERVNLLNYLNFSGYVINLTVVFGAGTWYAKELKSIQEISIEYEPLLNPAGWAFAIWSIIFLAQGIFAICQFFPAYRSHPLVQNGVGIWFFAACIAQSLWVFAFLSDKIIASMLAMISILFPLIIIVVSQQNESYCTSHLSAQEKGNSLAEFWLLRFPFEIHCGWIIVATILNANIVIVARGLSLETQIAATMISLALVLMATTIALFVPKKRSSYTIAFVLAWAMFATNYGMQASSESVILSFGETLITSVQYASVSLCEFIIVLIMGRAMWMFSCIKANDNEIVSPENVSDLLLNEEIPLRSAAF